MYIFGTETLFPFVYSFFGENNFSAIAIRQYRWNRCVFRLSICRTISSRQILFPRYLNDVLSNLDETYGERPLGPTDDVIRFLGQGHSKPSRWRKHPRQSWSVASLSFCCQVLYRSWKVLEFYCSEFQALEKGIGPGIVNQPFWNC